MIRKSRGTSVRSTSELFATDDSKALAVDRLRELLVEDILNSPADELLAEVREDYGEPYALARKGRTIIERTVGNYGSGHGAPPTAVGIGSPIWLNGSLRWFRATALDWRGGLASWWRRSKSFLGTTTPFEIPLSAVVTASLIIFCLAVPVTLLHVGGYFDSTPRQVFGVSGPAKQTDVVKVQPDYSDPGVAVGEPPRAAPVNRPITARPAVSPATPSIEDNKVGRLIAAVGRQAFVARMGQAGSNSELLRAYQRVGESAPSSVAATSVDDPNITRFSSADRDRKVDVFVIKPVSEPKSTSSTHVSEGTAEAAPVIVGPFTTRENAQLFCTQLSLTLQSNCDVISIDGAAILTYIDQRFAVEFLD